MVHAGCVFVASIHTSIHIKCQDLLNLCDGMHMCTYYTVVYTLIQKSFTGMESEPILTPRKKYPLPEVQRRVEPTSLQHPGQQAQHTTDWASVSSEIIQDPTGLDPSTKQGNAMPHQVTQCYGVLLYTTLQQFFTGPSVAISLNNRLHQTLQISLVQPC